MDERAKEAMQFCNVMCYACTRIFISFFSGKYFREVVLMSTIACIICGASQMYISMSCGSKIQIYSNLSLIKTVYRKSGGKSTLRKCIVLHI